MKEVKCKLYKFEELSDEVRREIVEKKTSDIADSVMYFTGDEYQGSLEKFEEYMGIKVHYSISYCEDYHSFKFNNPGLILGESSFSGRGLVADEVCGKYLRRYLNNNFMFYAIPRKKYVKYEAGYDRERNRWNKQRISRIQYERWDNCPLTGVCYDYEIMKPIVDCLAKPIKENYSLVDLINDVLDNFFGAWQREYEYWNENKENCIEEELIQRYSDDLFFEDGRMFNGIYEEVA